jgi:hypothetical protein
VSSDQPSSQIPLLLNLSNTQIVLGLSKAIHTNIQEKTEISKAEI